MTNFCPTCGTRCKPEWQFCAECGDALTAEGPRLARTRPSPGAGIAVFCVLAVIGVGIWTQIIRQRPALVRQGSPGAVAMQTGNLGGAGPSEGLPEGHPPLGEMRLPEEMKKFIAKLSAEAKNQPENAAAWERLSEVQHRAARVDKAYRSGALESYRHLLELTPGSTKALRGLASIYYDLGDYRSAQPHLENYLTLQPRDLGAQTDLATVKMRLGDVERAIEDYRKVIQANPQFFQAHLHLGLALHQTGKKREALNTLREASKVAGNDQMRAQVEHLIRQLDGSS